MEVKTPIVHLGYLDKPVNKLSTNAIFFPSFIGGSPSFLSKLRFIPDMTVCKRCNSRLTFICQLYCPIDGNADAFHRMIYVYCCLKSKWKESTESIRVFRTQLPLENPYFSKQAPNYDLLDMNDSELNKEYGEVLDLIHQNEKQYKEAFTVRNQSKKVSNLYMIGIEPESEKVTRSAFKKLSKFDLNDENEDSDLSDSVSQKSGKISSSEQEIMDKHSEDEDEGEIVKDDKEAKELLKAYAKKHKDKDTLKMLENDDDNDEDEKLNKEEQDIIEQYAKEFDNHKAINTEFEIFLEVIKLAPSQVIRYSNDGMLPLWSGKKYKLSDRDIPECELWGGKMTYELQLMPALWNYINEMVSLNWNSVMIYTWDKSWQPTEYEYAEEFGYVELIDEKERQGQFSGTATALDPFAETKKSKEKKKLKPKPKDKDVDAEVQAQIKEQLEALQLDLE